MNSHKSPALQLAEWVVEETRKAIPYSTNRAAYSQVLGATTQDDYLKILQDLLRADIKKRGSDEKAILDEIRRKIGIEFLPEDVLQDGIGKIFPLTIHALGRQFISIESLFHYVSNRFAKTILVKPTYDGLEYTEVQAIRGLKNRIGNCGETSAFATLLFMEYPEIPSGNMPTLPKEDIKLERVTYASPGDHSFVILNRTSGQIENILSWNDDAVVCDPWIGVSYTIAQWKRWHKKEEVPSHYIIDTKYKLELNDPFRRWKDKPFAYVGEKHNQAHNIPVHSDKWNQKHQQKNKSFRPLRLISLDLDKDLLPRQIYQAAKKGDIHYIETNKQQLPNIDRNALFEVAIENGHIDLASYLIDNKLVNQDNAILFLKIAVENNHLELFEYLIKQKETTITLDEAGIQILLLAAMKNGYTNVIDYFFEHYNNLTNLVVRNNSIVLVAAIENDHLHMLKHLNKHGIDINQLDNKNLLLNAATQNGHLGIIQYIVSKLNPMEKNSLSQSMLHRAAAKGHLHIVEYCLKTLLVDIDGKDNTGNTALHFAAENGHIGLIQYLIEYQSAKPNEKNNHGDTPLMIAVNHNQDDTVDYFLKNNIGLNNVKEMTAVQVNYLYHTAVKKDTKNLLKNLINVGADIESKNNQGETPLHLATQANSIRIVRFLISNRANIHATNNNNESALHVAAKDGNLKIVKFFVKNGLDINLVDKNNESPMIAAIKSDHLEIAEYLLNNTTTAKDITFGFSIDEIESYLRDAIKKGHTEVAKFMLNQAVDANIKIELDKIALHTAAEYGQVDMATYLINSGVDEQLKGELGNTALHIAAEHGNDKLALYLLNNTKININETNQAGDTPLMLSIRNGWFACTQELLRENANIPSPSQMTLKDWYILFESAYFSYDSIKLGDLIDKFPIILQAKSADNKSFLHCMADKPFIPSFALLYIKDNQDINATDNNYETALHIAASEGNLELVKLLIKCGADVNIIDKNNETPFESALQSQEFKVAEYMASYFLDIKQTVQQNPFNIKQDKMNLFLHAAALNDRPKLIEFFIKIGADIKSTNKKNNTALHLAVKNGNGDCVEILLNKGADISATNNNNETPLDIAINTKQIDIVDQLLRKGANIQENSEYTEKILALLLKRIKAIKPLAAADIKLSILKMAVKMGYVSMVTAMLTTITPTPTKDSALIQHSILTHSVKTHPEPQALDDLYASLVQIAENHGQKEMQEYLLNQRKAITSPKYSQ